MAAGLMGHRTCCVSRQLANVVVFEHGLGLAAVDGVELVARVLARRQHDAVRAAGVRLQERRAVVHLRRRSRVG